MARGKAGALGALLGITLTTTVHAQGTGTCDAHVARGNVVGCALRASAAVRSEEHGLAAVEGRRVAASLVFPSNPTLSVSAGRRTAPALGEGLDWDATLSQEIEIAGQRGARLDVVSAEGDAQRARIAATRRDVAAAALDAYFDALAALEEQRVADRMVQLGDALTRLAESRLSEGLGTEVEAELAQAAAIRLAQAQVAAQRHVATARAELLLSLGLDPARPSPTVEGTLDPLAAATMDAEPLVRNALAQRSELLAVDAERRREERRADLFRRARVPDVTVSIFALNDNINERVFGVGLSLPIPIPAPVGHTYAGEIAEAEALEDRAASDSERLRREVRRDVLVAYENVAAHKREVALFSPERLKRAEDGLAAIARELDARRLAVRDALLAEQGLVQLLQSHVEARRQLCLASVELARVAAWPLEGGSP